MARSSRSEIDGARLASDNNPMEFLGRVKNGVIVLEGGPQLPEGTPVTVLCDNSRMPRKSSRKKRVRLPLVRSKHPGTLDLTNEHIAQILQEEDVRTYAKFFRKDA
jgi:hypothetical protein